MSTSYILGHNKPLINREQNYVLDRKLLSVHSEDRDITKYPQSNTFEIMLPETVMNVQSLRLVQATFPNKYYTFSSSYQNTQLQFTIGEYTLTIQISEGSYTAGQMALELTAKMNAALPISELVDGSFNVFHDEVSDKMWFGHSAKEFTLNFDTQLLYDNTSCPSLPLYWENYANWGLPYNLGFQKETYTSLFNADGVSFDYLCPAAVCPGGAVIRHYVVAPLPFVLNSETCIYMEVDKYNNYDELYPYNQSTRAPFDNHVSNGRVNAAFAKIPIQYSLASDISNDTRCRFLQNLVQYDPPIERIARLKFRFRFHDGRLVDFQNKNFDFSLEFNCLKNEIAKVLNVRIPVTYIL